jgi:hypothetical protein
MVETCGGFRFALCTPIELRRAGALFYVQTVGVFLFMPH